MRAQTKNENEKVGHGENIQLYDARFRFRIFGFLYFFRKTKIQHLSYPKLPKIPKSDPRSVRKTRSKTVILEEIGVLWAFLELHSRAPIYE